MFWSKWSLKKRLLLSSTTGLVLAILGSVMIPVLQYVVKKKVESTVVIREGGELYDIWKEFPIPIFMQIYMFNVTNHKEVLQWGAKPSLSQSGPYTYREKRLKFDITWNPNGTVSYRQKRTFHFVRNMSVGDETDIFITANPVYWALANAIKYEPSLVRKVIYDAVKFESEGVFLTRSVREIIWGYRDPLLNISKGIDDRWFYTDIVGYFMNKNDTDDGVYTVFTGEVDINTLGMINRYNGSDHLTFWTTEWANMINGSDGTLGPPYTTKDQELYAFASDVCRSIAGVFDVEVSTSQGIPLRRYKAPLAYMAPASENPDNIGFCTPQTNCLGAGILNLTKCQTVDFFHLPVAMSFPHFYLADKQYQDGVIGLHPNKEEHETLLDVEPYTGLVLRAAKRLMVNVYMEPIPDMKDTLNLTSVFLPIFWINETAVVDDANADKLKRLLFTPLNVIAGVEITLISLGGLILLISLVFCVINRKKQDNSDGKPWYTNQNDDETKPLVSASTPSSYGDQNANA